MLTFLSHLRTWTCARTLRKGAGRPGITLIEVLLFVALLGVIGGIALPLLFSATENRLLQQTVSLVEQNGAQLMQTLKLQVRNGEKIVLPAAGQTGSFLVLRTAGGEADPTVIGTSSGTVILIRRLIKRVISSPQVAVEDFVARNTSVSPSRQSVHISFTVSRTFRLQTSRSYQQYFEATINLLPDDIQNGNPCGCAAPSCNGPESIRLRVCDGAICATGDTSLDCVLGPP